MLTPFPPATILIDGRLVSASQSAYVQNGTIMAPVDPFVLRIATSVDTDASRRRVTIRRGTHAVTLVQGDPVARVDGAPRPLPIAPYVRDGRLIIPLAAVARGLEMRVRYEPSAHAAYLQSPRPERPATMAPFAGEPSLPAPAATFTAEPAVTPRPIFSGVPSARRTPIEVDRSPL